MKAGQIHSLGATEPLKVIAASNGVKKLGPKEGRTKQVGDVRLTWKATGFALDRQCQESDIQEAGLEIPNHLSAVSYISYQ